MSLNFPGRWPIWRKFLSHSHAQRFHPTKDKEDNLWASLYEPSFLSMWSVFRCPWKVSHLGKGTENNGINIFCVRYVLYDSFLFGRSQSSMHNQFWGQPLAKRNDSNEGNKKSGEYVKKIQLLREKWKTGKIVAEIWWNESGKNAASCVNDRIKEEKYHSPSVAP